MTYIKKDKENFLTFYENSAGNVSIACKKLNISRNTFYEWCKKDEWFASKISEEEEALLDFAESMLHKGIREGRTAEILFFLKTKGKKRGYIERQEITGADGDSSFVVRIVDSLEDHDKGTADTDE